MTRKSIDQLIRNNFKDSERMMPLFRNALETMNDFLDGRSEDGQKAEEAKRVIENFSRIKRQETKKVSRMIAALVKQDRRNPMAKRIFA